MVYVVMLMFTSLTFSRSSRGMILLLLMGIAVSYSLIVSWMIGFVIMVGMCPFILLKCLLIKRLLLRSLLVKREELLRI